MNGGTRKLLWLELVIQEATLLWSSAGRPNRCVHHFSTKKKPPNEARSFEGSIFHWTSKSECILPAYSPQVFLSTRRGSWVLNRVGTNGIPGDMIFNRAFRMAMAVLPFGFLCNLAEKRLNERFNHALYGLKPKHRYSHVLTFYLHCIYCIRNNTYY